MTAIKIEELAHWLDKAEELLSIVNSVPGRVSIYGGVGDMPACDKYINVFLTSRSKMSQQDIILEALNAVLGGHGIESIRDPESWSAYWGDTVALYVNMGDTYDPTIVYDVANAKFVVTSHGDWVEAYQVEVGHELP